MRKLLFGTQDDISPLLLRLTLGVVFFPHGAQKVLGWFGGPGLGATLDTFVNKLGFPAWTVFLLLAVEFLGSIGLIFGLLTRLTVLGLAFSMTVCAVLNHIQHGFFMNWFGRQQGEGIEFHILVLGICLVLFIKGSGTFSLDRTIAGKSSLPGSKRLRFA